MSNRQIISLLFCLAFLVVSCSPKEIVTPGDSWDYSDLRILSPYDDKSSKGDFIAAYSRFAGNDLELRFDFLDLFTTPDIDLYIALDTEPGGTQLLPLDGSAEIKWDTLLILPASGIPFALSSSSIQETEVDTSLENQYSRREDLVPRVIRIPWQDFALISVNKSAFSIPIRGIKIQAFSSDQGTLSIQDSIGPFSINALPPQPAPVVLAFWNTFPAYTPAQSLRRWDGAHTGPLGERHGLSILLNNIKRFRVPTVLLDLRNPHALSALDHIGAISYINQLASEKLLVLPDSYPGSPTYPLFPIGLPDWAGRKYREDLKTISEVYGLPSSNIFYAPYLLDENLWNYSLTFCTKDTTSTKHLSDGIKLPVPDQFSEENQATPDGPSIQIRKQLLDNALEIRRQNDNYPLLILGGSFPDSAFGDPTSSSATFSYLANHPWIKPLNSDELRSLPDHVLPQLMTGTTTLSSVDSFSPSAILENLPNPNEESENLLLSSAWQYALSLYSPLPPEPDTLSGLRSIYSGQTGILLEAARWANNPTLRRDCQSDADLDGIPECVLASNNQFAIFDLEGARLIAYFYLSESGLHQIIAPTSQFIIGLGDPSSWQLDNREGAETAGVHGAFVDSPPPWVQYNVSGKNAELTFTSPDQSVTKEFSLFDNGIKIEISGIDSISTQIPIAIDPWKRFSPAWSESYSYQPIPEGFMFRINDQSVLKILTDSSISAQMFIDSFEHLSGPEDPNFNYPKGHYLPFPMALLELQSKSSLSVEMAISTK